MRRRHEQRAVLPREAAVGNDAHGAREVHVALAHDHLHAGMRRVRCPKHGHALVRLVDAVMLVHRHQREHGIVVRIDQRDLAAVRDGACGLFIRRQRDRNRPERAVARPHVVAYTGPVRARHEAFERREPAEAHHDQVALFARSHDQPRQ